MEGRIICVQVSGDDETVRSALKEVLGLLDPPRDPAPESTGPTEASPAASGERADGSYGRGSTVFAQKKTGGSGSPTSPATPSSEPTPPRQRRERVSSDELLARIRAAGRASTKAEIAAWNVVPATTLDYHLRSLRDKGQLTLTSAGYSATDSSPSTGAR